MRRAEGQGAEDLDKVADKVTGDAYDYADTTKLGIDDAKLSRNVAEFAKTVTFSVAPKLAGVGGATKDGIFLAKCYVKAEELHGKVRDGKLTEADAAAAMARFIVSENISSALATTEAKFAWTMRRCDDRRDQSGRGRGKREDEGHVLGRRRAVREGEGDARRARREDAPGEGMKVKE